MNARNAKATLVAARQICVTSRSRRRSTASATAPPPRAKTRIGTSWTIASRPIASGFRVSSHSSSGRATTVTWRPRPLTSWPSQSIRKSRSRRTGSRSTSSPRRRDGRSPPGRMPAGSEHGPGRCGELSDGSNMPRRICQARRSAFRPSGGQWAAGTGGLGARTRPWAKSRGAPGRARRTRTTPAGSLARPIRAGARSSRSGGRGRGRWDRVVGRSS